MEDAGETLTQFTVLGWLPLGLVAGGRILCVGQKTLFRFEELSKFVI